METVPSLGKAREVKQYWDRKIRLWEASVYDRNTQGLSPLERLATLFRSLVKGRMEEAAAVLAGWIPGKTVVDVGCGSGLLAERLLDAGAAKVTGLDIAPAGIASAQDRLVRRGIDRSRYEFREQNLATHPETPQADVTVGLGFLDYLDPSEIVALFRHIRSPKFLFSFPERQYSVRMLLHEGYLRLAGCPVFYKYSRAEFDRLLRQAGRFHDRAYYQRASFRFVHNIPDLVPV